VRHPLLARKFSTTERQHAKAFHEFGPCTTLWYYHNVEFIESVRQHGSKDRQEVEPWRRNQVDIFDDMREAMQDALAYERGGGCEPARHAYSPAAKSRISAKEVRLIRRALNASQSLFAGYLNVSPMPYGVLEQGTRRPRQPRSNF